MQAALAFDQAPPFHGPLRFFLTAPLFGIAAGLLLAWVGPEAFSSRWHPGALALTHLLTLGLGTMSMTGALMQVLPVVAGAPLARPGSVATLVHGGLSVGTLLLAAAFLTSHPALYIVAALFLGAALSAFVAAAGWAAFRTSASGPPLPSIRLALMALAVTAVLGVLLALGRADPGSGGTQLTAAHVGWGLAGWTAVLVAGVAYRVVPMFQLTPSYPDWITRGLAPALLLLLALWSAAGQWGPPRTAGLLALPVAALLATFGMVTLGLQARRRRRTPEPSVRFWRVGMVSLIAAAGLWAWLALMPTTQGGRIMPLALGVAALAGATASVICGMFYKIVPFLAWLHLQPLSTGRWRLPNMKELMPERAVNLHFALHCVMLLLLFAATMSPEAAARPAGAAMALAFGVLEWNLAAAALRYRGTRVKLEALARLCGPGAAH